MKIKTLDDMFLHTLKDIHYAETKILKALPAMISAAHDSALKDALTKHKTETEGQIERIKAVFSLLEKKPAAVECEAINGIIKEAEGMLDDTKGTPMADLAVISSGQAVEHYEIVRYRCLVAWADELNMLQASKLLQQSLDEEMGADTTLGALAEMAGRQGDGARRSAA